MRLRSAIETGLYRYGWDTRCRNVAAARLLRKVLAPAPTKGRPVLLDVGSGGQGVATFLSGFGVIGIDREKPDTVADGLAFHRGDIRALPYLDGSFPVVSCIDVLEHLSLNAREAAIRELLRVASHAVLIACPHGEIAKECDEAFRIACEARGRSIPGWLDEHQRQSYPVTSQIVRAIQEAAAESGRVARTSVSYCEPAKVCRLVRGAAARSDVLYVAANLLMGALFSFLRPPDADNSYRMFALAELT